MHELCDNFSIIRSHFFYDTVKQNKKKVNRFHKTPNFFSRHIF